MIEVKKDKLFVCNVDGTMQILTRTDVDELIRDAEENDDDTEFSTLGSFMAADLFAGLVPFLIICKLGDLTITDVITASDQDDAITRLVSKKRFQKSKSAPDVKSIKDLTNLVQDYIK